jgi:hypothetical protein
MTTARWLFNEGPLGEFQGIAALEVDGVRYAREEVERIVIAHRTDQPTALQLAQEWQEAITILAADTAECLELDMEIGLKEKRGHPFWWGKVSVLRTLKAMADADVERCSPRPLEKL